jgi:hypothetical protein
MQHEYGNGIASGNMGLDGKDITASQQQAIDNRLVKNIKGNAFI